MRAIIYVRVSRVRGRQGDAFLSPIQQSEACEAWVRMKRGAIVARVEDLDVSGGTIERPGFQKALRMIEEGEADTLVVAKLDRFGRTIPGIYEAVQRIEDAGGHFASVSDGFDLTIPTGHLLLGVLASFAEYELRRLKAGWEDVHVRNVEAGVPTRFPWGYERGHDPERRPDDRDGRGLVPTAEGRRLVPALFRRAAEGTSHRDLARWLNAEGSRTKTGGPWERTTVTRLLENRTYLGEVRYGDLFNPEAHEALIDAELFHAARKAPGLRAVRTGTGLLTSLARCANCRHALTHKPASPSLPNRIYRCDRKPCDRKPAVKADDLEALVLERVFELAEGETLGIVQEGGVAADFAEVLAELERLGAARTALGAVRDVLPDAAAQLDALDARAAELELELAEAPEAPRVTPEDFEGLEVEERREILLATLDAVFVRSTGGPGRRAPLGPRVLVLARGDGPGPEELPRRGYPRQLDPVPFPGDDAPAGTGMAS